MSRRLTVVQMLPALEGGGVERGTLEVGAELVRQGHRSIVISAGGRLLQQLRAEGSEHLAWDVGRKRLWTLRYVRRLRRYLESFVMRGAVSRSDLMDRKTIETLSGRTLSVVIDNGRPFIEGARILFADQVGRNGLVHIVHPAWAPAAD